MQTPLHYWSFGKGIHRSPVDPIHSCFVGCLTYSLNLKKLSIKQSNCLWFEMFMWRQSIGNCPHLCVTGWSFGSDNLLMTFSRQGPTFLLHFTCRNSRHHHWMAHWRVLISYDIRVKLGGLTPINSYPPSAVYTRLWNGSALVQVMACRLFGAKPLLEPMLAYCQLDSWELISVKFE